MTNIELLKTLTQNTFDSVEGYRLAHEKASTPALRNAFERRMKSRQKTLGMLNDALVKNGADRITSASTAGDAHQIFLKIADALTNSDKAAINRVNEGEQYLAKSFRDALKRGDIDTPLKMLIEQASRDVLEGESFSDMLEEQYA